MITILNISDTKFSYNGIAYFKNFTPFVTGNKVSIVNTYDACISLTNFPTIYSDISVDGVTYGSVAALQNALLPVLFNRTFTQAGSLTVGYIPKATGINTLGNSLIYDNGTNIGVGTTATLTKLTINGNLSLFTTNQIRLYNSAKNNWTEIASPLLGGDSEVDFRILTKTGTFYINASGNVGIGTPSPVNNLHIQNGTAANTIAMIQSWGTESAGEHAGIRFKSAAIASNEYGKGFIGFRNNGTGYGRGDLYFCLNNSTDTSNAGLTDSKMIITSGGEVLAGTTSNTYVSRLVLYGGASSNTLECVHTGTANTYNVIFSNGNGAVGSIQTNGSSTSYVTSSDYRLKQDLKPINGLDLVSQIKVYDYEWKSDETRAYGVLAHELQEVIPQAVNGEKDAEQMQGVDYSKLVPILVQAIQELKAELQIIKN